MSDKEQELTSGQTTKECMKANGNKAEGQVTIVK